MPTKKKSVKKNVPTATAKTTKVEKPVTKSVKEDLTKILGVTEQIERALNTYKVNSYQDLGACTIKNIMMMLDEKKILDKAKYYTTWTRQAKLARVGDWDALKKYKAEIKS